jgi:acetolactate synthase-1/2/3 large subunit
MKYNGADIVLKSLKKLGVDTLFGYPGGAVIPLYDALYRLGGFKHIRTAHEQGAVHAADGYARATGKVGVCIATSGPGATNTITGIATAFMDSIPLVVITGQVPSGLLGKDAFQEIDITGITFQITKHNIRVKSVEELEQAMYDAYHIASSGRPGPVLIDIPKDILNENMKFHDLSLYEAVDQDYVSDEEIKEVARLIEEAEKPIIYAGGGVKIGECSEELRRIAVKSSIPVVNTLMGLGSFPRNHELSFGLVGMHGFPETNLAVANCDLIIAIGARFSDRVTGNTKTFSKRSKVIHIDVDKTEFSKNINADKTLLGHMKDTLVKLERALDLRNRKAWLEQIQSYRVDDKSSKESFVPKNIYTTINKYFNGETVVSTDVGQHQMWTAQYWKFKEPRTFITSGGLGTMGFGLGAAIGVSIAGRPSVLITGDGSFRMNCHELATVSQYNLPITMVLINNQTLGMVRQWQDMFQDKRYSETCIDDNLDYIKLGEAYGIKSVKVESIDALNKVLTEHTKQRPLLIECRIDKNEKVLPIVPPGSSISNFVLG